MAITATFDTPNFTFEATGRTRADALDLLSRAWVVHCQQTQADPTYLAEFVEDVNFGRARGRVGVVTRDDTPILTVK